MLTLRVSGMTCGHCIAAVTKAVQSVPAVDTVSVDLASGTVMMGGTMSAIGGIRPASRFEMELEDPATGDRIMHAYEIEVLPVVS